MKVKKPELKAAYHTVIEHVDFEIKILQEENAERQLSEPEPTCQTIASGAILRQLQKFRQKLFVRYSRL